MLAVMKVLLQVERMALENIQKNVDFASNYADKSWDNLGFPVYSWFIFQAKYRLFLSSFWARVFDAASGLLRLLHWLVLR